jgi:hypothetical protein
MKIANMLKRVQELINYIFLVLGGIASIVSLVLILASKGFRAWGKTHSDVILALLVVAVMLILVLLFFMQSINNKYRTLQSLHQSDRSQFTDQDRELARQIRTRMPPAGTMMKWLKIEFNPFSIPQDRAQSLSELREYLDQNVADFDDKAAAKGLLELRASISRLSLKIAQWTSLEAGTAQRIVPIEWIFEDERRYWLAITEIKGACDDSAHAHNRLLLMFTNED